jgi:hypothetical protein
MKLISFFKRSIPCCIFLFLFSSASFAQTRYLIPYRDGRLWGYADTNRKIVVAPQYEMAYPFHAGYAIVKKGKFYGILNGKGKVMIPALYDTLKDCCSPYLTVMKGDNTGVIELKSGKILLPVKYKKIETFYNDYRMVTDQNSLTGVMNLRTGKWILTIAYLIKPTRLNWYKAANSDTTLYFKAENDQLVFGIPLEPEEVSQVAEQVPPNIQELKSANGNSVIHVSPIYDSLFVPRGMSWLNIVGKNGKWGVYSFGTDREIIPLIYDKVEAVYNRDFKEFFIVTREGKTGVVDKENKVVVPLRYEEVQQEDRSVYNNFYVVKLKGRIGVVNGNEQVLPCDYDYLWDWDSNGTVYILYKNNKSGIYIYRANKGLPNIFIEPKYDRVVGRTMLQPSDFDPDIHYPVDAHIRNIIIEVYKNNKKGYVNQNGQEFFKN